MGITKTWLLVMLCGIAALMYLPIFYFDPKLTTCISDALFLLFPQVFKKFVEIGRVAYIAFGPDEGKLAAIVDVIDQNRVSLIGEELLKFMRIFCVCLSNTFLFIITQISSICVRIKKQGKSEGFDSCDRPSNLTQIGFKLSIFQSGNAWFGSKWTIFLAEWPWNLTDDLQKQQGTSSMLLQALCSIS